MVFIVEMFNGSSNRTEIMGLDEEGELYVEKVIEHGPPDSDYRKFSCSSKNWEKALELGQKLGWKPNGSVLEKTLDSEHPKTSDYEPSSWGEDDYKIFTAKDASELADALDKALELMNDLQFNEKGNDSAVFLTSSMTESDFKQINRNLSKDFLKDFIIFLRKGKFNFVWDD